MYNADEKYLMKIHMDQFCIYIFSSIKFSDIVIIINGLILPLYPVLCCFKRDFYSVSSGSRDTSVLLSLLLFSFSPFQMIGALNTKPFG